MVGASPTPSSGRGTVRFPSSPSSACSPSGPSPAPQTGLSGGFSSSSSWASSISRPSTISLRCLRDATRWACSASCSSSSSSRPFPSRYSNVRARPLLPRARFPAKIRQPRAPSALTHERRSLVPEQADPEALELLIRSGEVDTVLTVFPDGMGRLMGKRVVGRYFLDHVLEDGVHACIYLFTVDMEMEPLPGFTLTSWEQGYGDMKLVPDLSTLRLIPWLPKTALVFCDVYAEDGEPIEEAPRWILRRQVARAASLGYVVKTAAELELYCFKESFA